MPQIVNEPYIKRLLFASKRTYDDGKFYLQLVAPNSSYNAKLEEKWLNDVKDIKLGDFVYAEVVVTGNSLRNIEKAKHNAKLEGKVEGDEAFIENIRATLIDIGGVKVFKNEHFPNALCRIEPPPALGEYTIRIGSMRSPKKLANGRITYFEAGRLVKIEVPASSTSTSSSIRPVVGTGFTQEKSGELVKLLAVVLNIFDNNNNLRTHYLWILDKKGEGRFLSKTQKLEEGQVFEGLFKKDPNSSNKWTCHKYEKPTQNNILKSGKDSKDRLWFEVKLENFQKAGGNRRFPSGEAKCFGEIVDTYSKLKQGDDCNGKRVKIQRRRGEHDKVYCWMIIEVSE